MGAIILLLVSALFIGSVSSPDRSKSVIEQQKPKDLNVAGAQTELNTPDPTKALIPKSDSLEQAVLIKVVDGDTITVSIKGKKEVVRVIGIDTPEVVDPRKTVECFGKEASGMANVTFENNKTVLLESDPTQGDRDKYQRLLRYVWVDDGVGDFGRFMIDGGYASEYTYNLPYKYQNEYKQAEKVASKAKKGLWANDACVSQTEPTQRQPTTNMPTYSGGDKDCSDFATQEEAQAYFESKGGKPNKQCR